MFFLVCWGEATGKGTEVEVEFFSFFFPSAPRGEHRSEIDLSPQSLSCFLSRSFHLFLSYLAAAPRKSHGAGAYLFLEIRNCERG